MVANSAEHTGAGNGSGNGPGQDPGRIRADKWLWYARFFKSRSIASKLCAGRRLRINSIVVAKASVTVKCGDVLTFPQAKQIRIIKIVALGDRRGPAPEAVALYEDVAPPQAPSQTATTAAPGGPESGRFGRPTKRDRRITDRLRSKD